MSTLRNCVYLCWLLSKRCACFWKSCFMCSGLSFSKLCLYVYWFLKSWSKIHICIFVHKRDWNTNTQIYKKQARKLERCATLRWNLRTAVKLAHSQNCRPQSRKKSKWNLCNCDCCKTSQRLLQTAEMEKSKGVISRQAIPSHKWVPQK